MSLYCSHDFWKIEYYEIGKLFEDVGLGEIGDQKALEFRSGEIQNGFMSKYLKSIFTLDKLNITKLENCLRMVRDRADQETRLGFTLLEIAI